MVSFKNIIRIIKNRYAVLTENMHLKKENKRLRQWVHDLQSGMYINCVYCGHRYGPRGETPITMADTLKKHIEKCPEHPLSYLTQAVKDAEYVFANKELSSYIFAQAEYLQIYNPLTPS